MYCGTMVVCEAVIFLSIVYTQEVGWVLQVQLIFLLRCLGLARFL